MRWRGAVVVWVLAALVAGASAGWGAEWDARGTKGKGARWAKSARKAADSAKAEQFWARAVKEDPDSGEALAGLGRALLANGKAATAEKVFSKLRKKWPGEAEGHRLFAEAALARKEHSAEKLEAALDAVEDAASLDGGAPETLLAESRVRFALGDFEGALVAAEEALAAGGRGEEYRKQEEVCKDALVVFSPLD